MSHEDQPTEIVEVPWQIVSVGVDVGEGSDIDSRIRRDCASKILETGEEGEHQRLYPLGANLGGECDCGHHVECGDDGAKHGVAKHVPHAVWNADFEIPSFNENDIENVTQTDSKRGCPKRNSKPTPGQDALEESDTNGAGNRADDRRVGEIVELGEVGSLRVLLWCRDEKVGGSPSSVEVEGVSQEHVEVSVRERSREDHVTHDAGSYGDAESTDELIERRCDDGDKRVHKRSDRHKGRQHEDLRLLVEFLCSNVAFSFWKTDLR
mmetsp:Transcript_19734/g.47115  ORF Transcript_19734/g.47115 Transcript_19734/m.47115 type:complete len:266 (+) Transcript_19734:49-846(+)